MEEIYLNYSPIYSYTSQLHSFNAFIKSKLLAGYKHRKASLQEAFFALRFDHEACIIALLLCNKYTMKRRILVFKVKTACFILICSLIKHVELDY